MDEIADRIQYNRDENERYFQAVMKGMSHASKVEFQMRLLDGMFSVIDAEDFKMICLKIACDMTKTTLTLDGQGGKIVQ